MSKDKIQVSRLMGANVYLEGASLLGKAGVVTLPDITYSQSEHNSLGMVGNMNFPTGVEAMTAQISWTSYYSDVMLKTANPYKSVKLQVRGSVASYNSTGMESQVPVVFHLTGTPTNFPLGTINPRDNPEVQSSLNCTAVKVTCGGVDIFELDVLSNIFKVGGEDIMAEYNRNIGLT